jgi:cholesterol oxidase
MTDSYDVVVIGSGFGGSVAGCRLAQAGRSVCILERGKRWGEGDFPRTIGQVAKAFWDTQANSFGFLEYRAFRRIDVIQGCGVGGGSLHYFNVHLRTPAEIFQQKEWPTGLTRQVLDPYYDLAHDMLDVSPLHPPADRGLPPRTTAFLEAAKLAGGKEAGLVPIAVYTGAYRGNPHSGLPQTGCDYQGNCMLGCDLHAKNSLDLNYLPLAEKYGATVCPLHLVNKIEPLTDGRYQVHFERLDGTGPGSVMGKTVIISAGTLGSTELLLRCRDEHGTLPNLSPMLGCRFSGNGDFILAGTFDADREIDPSQGPSITAGADFSTNHNRIYIEDLGYPNPFMWLVEGMLPSPHRLKDLFIAAVTYVLATLGCHIGRSRVSFEAQDLFQGGVTSRFLPYLGMGTDAANGRLKLKDGAIDIRWSPRKSKPMYKEMERALKKMSRTLHGKYFTSILWRWPLRKLLTAHPLGGCPMGDSAATGVANHWGQVWNYPNLYVVDGSIIPTALSVNPSATISALAERIAFWMIHGREMIPGDPDTPRNT